MGACFLSGSGTHSCIPLFLSPLVCTRDRAEASWVFAPSGCPTHMSPLTMWHLPQLTSQFLTLRRST